MSEDKKQNLIKCPYCAEEIRQEAIACKHCGKDLHFFRPLFEKISGLEKKLMDLIEINQTYKEVINHRQISTVQEKHSFLYWRHLVVISISVASFALIQFLLDLTDDNSFSEHAAIFFLLLSPFPAYIWYGFSVPGKHLNLYVLGGITTGILNFFVDKYCFPDVTDWAVLGHQLSNVKLLAGFILFALLVSLCGAAIGDWLESRKSAEGGHLLAEEIASKILGRGNPDNNSTIKRIASVIKILLPLLTIVSTLLASSFSEFKKVDTVIKQAATAIQDTSLTYP